MTNGERLETTRHHPAQGLDELETELQRAVDEIARGECIVLSVEDVERWAETGVAPWPDDSPG